MKKPLLFGIALLLCVLCLNTLPASSYDDYEEHPYGYQPYFVLEKGKATIQNERAPFFGLSTGTQLTSRLSVGAFGSFQLLSDFPESNFGLTITETDSAFMMLAGVEFTITLFKDAGFNPFLEVSAGGASVGYLEGTTCAGFDTANLHHYFYSSVATGIELGFSRNLQLVFSNGYRYIPHDAVLGLSENKLSGHYTSVALKTAWQR
ncbi:MAG: hypothetical protein CVV52_13155 [Spirochaetae bacterium HGW-Spirochaetae-8]|jgi:hypothetical protein|nr:MAG: hypothetical protein CVV52_13155 [Spirochaetae bacterium HGW-Spirochaetae-8]